MVDTRSPAVRSAIMRAVGSRNTGPELVVRRALHRLGYRFRLHRTDLPGTPDIVLPGRSAVIFVHGCFWHGHRCRKGRAPKSNTEFWTEKILRNRERDRRVKANLRRAGWRCATVWQCETRDCAKLDRVLVSFLAGN